MDRLDVRTAGFFAAGLLVLTFGCKGAHFHGLGHVGHVGHAAGSVAKVSAVAARRSVATVRVVDAVGRGVAVGTVARPRNEVIDEGAERVAPSCPFVCPAEMEGEPVFVCARQAMVVDAGSNQPRAAFVCDAQ